MRTGLTKWQKTTGIFFDEQSSIIEVQTHNTDLKKRLGAYAQQYPDLCRQTDDDGQGGLTFEIEKGRLSFRLTAPYSDERRSRASIWAKERGIPAGKSLTPMAVGNKPSATGIFSYLAVSSKSIFPCSFS